MHLERLREEHLWPRVAVSMNNLPAFISLAPAVVVLWVIVRRFIVRRSLDNIRGPKSESWLYGNFNQLFNRHGWEFHKQILQEYGGAVKLKNLFGQDMIYVSDPLALHHIVVKDQYVYEETGAFLVTNGLVFGPSLLSSLGDHHRRQRKMLNPVFSLKHMRGLLPIFYPIAHQLRAVLLDQIALAGPDGEVNMVKWMSRAALEYIGQGGLGYSFHVFDDASLKTDTYSEAIKSVSPTIFSLLLPRQFLPSLVKIGTPAFRKAVMKMVPVQSIQTILHTTDIMDKKTREIFQSKKDALQKGDEAVQDQIGRGKDIMSILMKANMDESNKADKLPEEELIGQMSTFILAAQDTTTGAACRIFHLLAENPSVQDKLRAEVTAARQAAAGDLDYDTLMSLPYLDAVCRETLRLYPPISQLSRTTRAPIVMPLQFPIVGQDGCEVREVAIPEGTDVVISIIGANRDKKIWGEDAESWKPERWLEPLPKSVGDARMPGVYASMMTFIGGGRACIGFKFAEMELKMVLSVLLEKIEFKPGPEVYWVMSSQASPIPVKQIEQGDFYPRLPLRLNVLNTETEKSN